MYDTQSASAGGAIWSTIAYSFESPLKALLDSPSGFTLEDLLDQDELLQELRSMHPQLIHFFSQEQVVAHLVQFLLIDSNYDDSLSHVSRDAHEVKSASTFPPHSEKKEEETALAAPATAETLADTTPSVNGTHPSHHWIYSHAIEVPSSSPTIECADSFDNRQDVSEDEEGEEVQHSQNNTQFLEPSSTLVENRYIRYPYMACEVICCEIPSILDILVTGNLPPSIHPPSTTCRTSSSTTHSLLPPPTSILDLLFSMLDSPYPLRDGSFHPRKVNGTAETTTTTTTTTTLSPKSKNSPPTQVHLLDDRRAGYLEKILSILFRERPSFMTAYLNGDYAITTLEENNNGGSSSQHTRGGRWIPHHSGGGIPLFQCFFQQLHSHSIMQIVQRLLMPQPFSTSLTPAVTEEEEAHPTSLMGISQQMSKEAFSEEKVEEEEGEIIPDSDMNTAWPQCKWMDSDFLLDLLMDRLFGLSKETEMMEEYVVVEASLHTCDILINIIQHSLLNSEILKKLTKDPYLGKLIYHASGFTVSPLKSISLEEMLNMDDSICTPTHFSRHDSIMTASISVLESLVLQLGGYGVVTTPEEIYAMAEQVKESANYMDNDSKAFLANTKTLIRYLPFLVRSLSKLLVHPETDHWMTYTQYSDSPQPLLGLSRLRIIRLIESLVLLGQKEIDQLLSASDCLEICLDFMWKFPWCSMLHQSVANLLVHVFEGEEDRNVLQKYFLYRCHLQTRLMEALAFFDKPRMEAAVPSQSLHAESIIVESVIVPKPTFPAVSSPKVVIVETDGVSNYEIEDEIEIPVSDDDVDSAMEQEDQIADIGSASIAMEASEHAMDQDAIKDKAIDDSYVVQSDKREPRNGSKVEAMHQRLNNAPRMGYLGHIIIVCQALMQACNHDVDDNDAPDSEGQSENPSTHGRVFSSAEQVFENIDLEGSRKRKIPPTASSFDDSSPLESEPVSLKMMVEKHPIYPQWKMFIRTVLAAEVTIQATTLGGVNSSSLTNYDRALAELDHDSNFVDGDSSYANNDPIELDENDLDIAASMMEALAIPRSELGDNSKMELFGRSITNDFSTDDRIQEMMGQGSHCYIYDDPLGSGRQFESDLDRNEESPFVDEDDPENNNAPVMDLYTGYFSNKNVSENFAPDDFNNFSTDWANFDNAFDSATESNTNNSLPQEELFPNDLASIT